VSVRPELYHHITTTRQHCERRHHPTIEANHTLRQRSSVQQAYVIQLVCTVTQLMSVQVEVSEVKSD